MATTAARRSELNVLAYENAPVMTGIAYGDDEGDEALADATLYAAAPDLLEALSNLTDAISQVQAARGEPSQRQRLVERVDSSVIAARAAISKATSANAGEK